MFVMDASRAARASAICRAVSGEWREGDVMLMLGECVEEDEEGRVGEMDVDGWARGLVRGWVGGGRGGGTEELEAWADIVDRDIVVYRIIGYRLFQLVSVSLADDGCWVVGEAELWSEDGEIEACDAGCLKAMQGLVRGAKVTKYQQNFKNHGKLYIGRKIEALHDFSIPLELLMTLCRKSSQRTVRKCNSKPCLHRNTNPKPAENPLLSQLALVESKLLTLQDVSITTSTLSWAGGDDGEQTTSLKLLLQSGLNLSLGSEALMVLLLDGLALLGVRLGDLSTGLLLTSATELLSVVGLVPLTERSGIDLDDGGAGEGVGSDQLVVGRMESDNDHTNLAGDTFRSPGEVAGFETKGTELAVATTGTDKMDSLCSDTGVGLLSAGFESALLPCKKS